MRSSSPENWHIWVDTGGTFTDCLAVSPQGEVYRAKVLSTSRLRGKVLERLDDTHFRIALRGSGSDADLTGFRLRLSDRALNPSQFTITQHDLSNRVVALDASCDARDGEGIEVETGEPAPILAARLVTRTSARQPLPRINMRLATTRGTNALLERAGEPVAFFVTEGFADLLRIGDQQRPDLFELDIRKPDPLYAFVAEAPERIAADGEVIKQLNERFVTETADALRRKGVRSAAIALMHCYRFPAHEKRIADILHKAGFQHVACSSELAPLIEILPRAETAVVDAYLGLLMHRYLDEVAGNLCGGRLHVMTSAGGLVAAEQYHAKDGLLSGPAGGVAGAAAAGRQSGFEHIIGFDMGGTSTDVCRVDGDFEYRFEHRVGGVRLVAPALSIETVAAGGGSICEFRDERLRVGPRSAGADPGPACYGAGGPLTITDINLLAGYFDPEQFEIPIHRDAASAAMEQVRKAIQAATGSKPSVDDLLDGFRTIANERMANAIEQISLRRGFDPADYALVSFGGAGGQHACAIASMLSIETVIMPPDASLLSAAGLGAAVVERFAQRQVLKPLAEIGASLNELLEALAEQATVAVVAEGEERSNIAVRRRIVNMRLEGQDTSIAVDADDDVCIETTFRERYQALYGFAPAADKPIEIESCRVVASARHTYSSMEQSKGNDGRSHDAAPTGHVRAYFGGFSGGWLDVPAYARQDLHCGGLMDGPAIIFDQRSAYVIDPGWRARIDEAGAIVARYSTTRTTDSNVQSRGMPEAPSIVRTELFANRFGSIAEEMGQILQRTALSTNVKRRLDFSCAVLDAGGQLLVNAPHIPVHLGAMGMCVRAVAESIDMKPGDCIVTNHPAFGGSHLPDITVITPVFAGQELRMIGYVANRAHHAELGGSRPGSMPPAATTLIEEGVVIEPQCLLRGGQSQFEAIEQLLRSGPYPSRAIEDNLADLRAQVAANHRGAAALRGMVEQYGYEEVAARMDDLKQRAQRLIHDALCEFGDGVYEAKETLDDGSLLCVRIKVAGGRAVIDFSGCSPQHSGNLNATTAIVRSVVLYVLRLLVGERLPLNEGLMQSIEIRIPECSILNPRFGNDPKTAPAVVGGNTETSQRLVDTMLKALKLAACSQGTMNNVLFGTDAFSYYETVCGGSGAGPGFQGADAVHTHMTNTRITDPEIIELRYPVRLERFSVRPDSGGQGQYRGGCGVLREMCFLAPMSLSVLTQHRVEQPYGLAGGEQGALGRQRVVRATGAVLTLQSLDQCDVRSGDRLVLETPGGGGFGQSPARR